MYERATCHACVFPITRVATVTYCPELLLGDCSSYCLSHAGIFHLYHPKHCDITLSKDQYFMCLGSKATSEASASQLGLLAFKELSKEHEKYHAAEGGV